MIQGFGFINQFQPQLLTTANFFITESEEYLRWSYLGLNFLGFSPHLTRKPTTCLIWVILMQQSQKCIHLMERFITGIWMIFINPKRWMELLTSWRPKYYVLFLFSYLGTDDFSSFSTKLKIQIWSVSYTSGIIPGGRCLFIQ